RLVARASRRSEGGGSDGAVRWWELAEEGGLVYIAPRRPFPAWRLDGPHEPRRGLTTPSGVSFSGGSGDCGGFLGRSIACAPLRHRLGLALEAPVALGLWRDDDATVKFDLARTLALPLERVVLALRDRVAFAKRQDGVCVAGLAALAVALELRAGLKRALVGG